MGALGVFLVVAGALAVFVVSGLVAHLYFYRKLGYPPMPHFMRTIRLRDDLDAIHEKIEAAILDGFVVKHRDEDTLIIEKVYREPACVMTIEFLRRRWESHNRVSVKCQERRWLNWSKSSGRTSGPRKGRRTGQNKLS